MPRIDMRRLLAVLTIVFPVAASAATDPQCIKHLGGAFAGVECFNGLTNDLKAKNADAVAKLRRAIPAGSPNARRLADYLDRYRQLVGDCELAREAMDGWKAVKPDGGARYRDADVPYYECIYDLQAAQDVFLTRLLENAGS